MRIGGTDTFLNLYGIVKAFLKEFYTESKKGTIKHRKGVIVFLSFVFCCLIVIAVTAYKISEQPFFCGLCHNMKVYVDSWKGSTHRNVGCIECHYKPGFKNHIIGKWKDGQISLVYFVTGKVVTKPHAEIDDASCLAGGCHKKEDLKEDIVFKNVIFNHLQHLEKMKRDKQLRCTTCHSQIVQGTHMTVTEVNCFICHFYKTKEQKEYITGCTSCHFEAKGDIKKGAYTFNHKKFIKRGIKCEVCHTNVVEGNGHLPDDVCLRCHNKREILEAKFSPEQLHRKHVTDHKVECFLCHSSIQHKITGFGHVTKEEKNCAQCHKNELHGSELLMFTGKGAKTAESMPSAKASLNMDCSVCHKPGQQKGDVRNTCRTCHGNLTEGMFSQWDTAIKTGQSAIAKDLDVLKGRDLGSADKKKVETILFNNNYLTRGKPYHNILYSLSIINENKRVLAELAGNKATAKGAPAGTTCMDTCHGNIADKEVSFGKITFPHAIHAEGEESCLTCHTPYGNHGNTVLAGCSKCHHGKGEGKVSCKDCHRSEEAMMSAKGSSHGRLGCAACHGAVAAGKNQTASAARNSCTRCHDRTYAEKAVLWTQKASSETRVYQGLRADLDKAISAIEAKEMRQSVPLRKLFNEIDEDVQTVILGRYAHNPANADAVLLGTKTKVEALRAMISDKQQGKTIRLR